VVRRLTESRQTFHQFFADREVWDDDRETLFRQFLEWHNKHPVRR
jgi:hypothetical protein